jgi:hypothetical protein
MNPSYFTEEHQLFREFKRFFKKKLYRTSKNGREQLNASYKFEKWAFWYKLSEVYGG